MTPEMLVRIKGRNDSKPAFDQVVRDAHRAGAAVEQTGARMGKSMQASGMLTANAAAQFNDWGVMMISGQNPLILGIQQGTQLNQVLTQMGGGMTAVRALGPALMSVVSPMSLLTIGALAASAAAGQWLIGMIGNSSKANRTLEEHASWLGEILTGYDDINEAAGEYLKQAQKLPAGLARIAVGQQLDDDIAALERTRKFIDFLASRDQAALPLGSFNQDLALIKELAAEFQSNAISADQLAEKLKLIEMNPSVNGELRDMAGKLATAAQEGEHLRAKIAAGRTALSGLSAEAQVAAVRMGNLSAAFEMLDTGAFNNGSLEAALKGPIDAASALQDMLPDVRDARQKAADALAVALNSPSVSLRATAQQDYDKVISALDAQDMAARRREGENAAKQQAAAYERVIEALQFETNVVGLNAREAEKLNQIRAAGVDGSSERAAAIRKEVDLLYDRRDAEAALQEQLKANVRELAAIENSAAGFMTGWGQKVRRGQDFWEAFKDSGLDALGAIADEFIRLGSISVVRQFLGGGMGGSADIGLGGGNWFTEIIKGLFGGRASGGPVSAGTLYQVNEGGGASVELFRPNQNGTVIPATHNRASATVGGGETVVHLNTTIHAENSSMGTAEFERVLVKRDREIEKRLPALLSKAKLHRKLGPA